MPIYERGKSFLVSIGSGPERFRATASSRPEAEAIESSEMLKRRQKALEQYLPSKPQAKPGVTLQRLLGMAKRGQWKDKIKGPAEAATLVVRELGELTQVHEITRETIRDLIETFYDEGNSGATINRKLSALSVLLTIAEDEGWIDRAPKLPRQSENKHRIHFFDNAEEAKMLAECERLGLSDLHDFIVFGIDTGFRRSELLGLTVSDCDNGKAVLHAGETKSGLARSVPLTARANAIVQKRRDMGYTKLFQYMSDAQLRKRWDTLKESLGYSDHNHFIVHTLRHTCASRLAMAGKNATFIQTWMGHSSIMVTQRYMHLAKDALLEGADALDDYRKKYA